ncbi:MAG: hypothetical protein JWN48_3035, partial [Myxococcaceae bacterium]|nr:hypothetical protein [Myxococcaceae bacterium]
MRRSPPLAHAGSAVSFALGCVLLAGCADELERDIVGVPSLDASLLDAELGHVPDAQSCADSIGFEDLDHDGFSRAAGDCDDCNLARGPGSIDVPLNGLDEDCSGADALAPPAACDAELEPDDVDPGAAAQALGLCSAAVTRASGRPGLIDARWLRLSGESGVRDDRQVWLPEAFGTIVPHEGRRLVALSTGVSRDRLSQEYTSQCDVFDGTLGQLGGWLGGQAPPAGFPKDSSKCPKRASAGALAFDDVGLELTLRAPGNASALAFDSLFLTYEYPDFVCSRYNDFFVALMDPAPGGVADHNVVVDQDGNPIGVNTALLSVCTATDRSALPIACEAGPELLRDTGYGARESSCAP